ncbi:protein translocase subunit SecD [Pseudonocardia oroxyli]|uniref:Protein translocase subunit SecD n=1 Tax=Pseudonocardia oroxyli TaxID=366584 RepID=A0A1G7IH11_PSEOR|nr:protein translocase subunit SecD [Pseudonocardia oroxyli]SDF11806.1 preprotein translocase subunit SecD [Pseudonocardia oroxyli]
MATTPGRIRPWRYLAGFAGIVVALYALVAFTGDRSFAPKLGIDLQGGTRVTMTARTADGQTPPRDQLIQAQAIIEQRVNGLGVSGAEVVLDGNNLTITVPGDGGEQARDLAQTAQLRFRPVVGQPIQATPADPAQPPAADPESPDAVAQAKQLRQSTDPTTQQIALQTLDCNAPDPLQGYDDPALPLVACDQNKTAKYVLGPTIVEGTEIASATATQDPNGVGSVVDLTFKSAGNAAWGAYTAANVGTQAAFVLDGEVVSAPTIQGALYGNTQVSGNFSQEQAQNLASVLRYGSLPLSFESSEAQTVSATLGLASLEAGLLAGAVGLILVFVYCLFYYRVLGLLTILSLILSGAVVYAVLVLLGRWIGFTLDLAGVAGFIVAIGITADSFVIFFERLKDEVREGRSFRSAVPRAWVRARRTILTADAVSFLAAAVLYILAVGQVKGFAFTLGMSTVLDLVVVFLVTHPLVALASNSKIFSSPALSGLGSVARIGAQRRRTRETASSGTKGA